MKKYLLLFCGILFFHGLFAQVLLKSIYHGEFEQINRLVIVTDRKPVYTIDKQPSNKKFTVEISNCAKADNYKTDNNFSSQAIKSLDAYPDGRSMLVEVATQRGFYLDVLELDRNEFKIVIDILPAQFPKTYGEYLSFADFAFKIDAENKAVAYYQKMEELFADNSGFYYYWGKNLLLKKKPGEAATKFAKVKADAKEYPLANKELSKLGKTPTAEPTSPPTEANTASDKSSTAQAKPGESAETEVADSTAGFDSRSLYEHYKQYFTSTDNLDLQLYLTGFAAKATKDYDKAIDYLKKINQSSPLAQDVYMRLYEIYKDRNDETNAKFYASLIAPEHQPNSSSEGFVNKKIPLWMVFTALCLVFLSAFFLGSIVKKRREEKEEPQFSVAAVEYHEERLKKGYEALDKEPVKKESPLTSEPKMEQPQKRNDAKRMLSLNPEELESELGFGGFKKSAPPKEEEELDFSRPPLVAEELSRDEESELEKEEMLLMKQKIFGEQAEEPETPTFRDDGYKKKVVLKLAQDGWDKQAIAKELQISQREVEFIIKMN